MRLKVLRFSVATVMLAFMCSAALAQEYGTRLGIQRGGSVSFEPQGPGVLFGPLDPSVTPC